MADQHPLAIGQVRVVDDDTPVPLSFPAFLRNPGLSDRFAHLRAPNTKPREVTTTPKKSRRRDENDGKRWVKRKENARFAGNPHIVAASKKDYNLDVPQALSTFPEPLPTYLPRSVKIPSIVVPARDPLSANAGRFSLSLKGMRRELRKSGFRAELLVRDIESEINDWLQGGTLLSPDKGDTNNLNFPGALIGCTESIREVSRTPLQLVWSIEDDSFARYVVHCCARYHEIVSFSKETSGQRLTYLLRPNVTYPDSSAAANLDTPPNTDMDNSSHMDSGSEFTSDKDGRSDAADSEFEQSGPVGHLTSITEDSEIPPASQSRPARRRRDSALDDGWSVIGDSDVEGDHSGSEMGLVMSVDSLSLQDDLHRPFETTNLVRPSPLRSRLLENRQGRSSSSPSPHRRPLRKPFVRPEVPRSKKSRRSSSFYDYLFK